ncbi:MAG: DUF5519 family protein [Abitibacteriaceae bacterium]|nr:DUF5519 family protein [Abditibacteriaceae bacterium]
MFHFVIKRLRFATRVPGLVHCFNALLFAWNLCFHCEIVRALDAVETAVAAWPGIVRRSHHYGGLQFDCAGREIGHLHGNGVLDIRFSKPMKDSLMQAWKVVEHHSLPHSGWISFWIHSPSDVPQALELLQLSYRCVRGEDSL